MTIQNIECYNLRRTPVLYIAIYERGIIMSNNKIELLKLICENDYPEEALLTAIEVISSFLEQYESYQEPSPGFLRALG